MAAETVTVLLYDNDPSTSIDTGNSSSHSVDEKFIWKESTTEKLLQLYRDNPCLYDSKCKDYHNRDTKRKVLEDIARTIGVNSNAVSKKIRGLRTQYVREKNKMKIRKSGDESYVTKWSYYERLKFLDEHITARSTQFKKEDGNETDNTSVEESVNDDTEDSVGDALGNTMSYYYVDDIHQSQPQQASVSEPEQTTLIKTNSLVEGRRKRKLSSVEDLLLQRALDNMDSVVAQKRERTSDRHEIFGMYVASEMREISDPEWFRWAKQKIQGVLCTAQAGTHPHSHSSCDGGGRVERRSSPPHPPHISEPNHHVRRDRSRGSGTVTATRLSGVELPYANSTDCLQLHTGYVQQASSIRHAD